MIPLDTPPKKRRQIKSDAKVARVAHLYETGKYSVSKIAKMTGVSYVHTKRIIEQLAREEDE